jgi:hypothetical protein
MNRRSHFVLFLLPLAACLHTPSASAQGLIFSLPEDGAGIEYEGKLIQETVRPELEDGREDAEYNGEIQPCRWIEIKVITGKAGAAGIDAGLVGTRIYKILVPERKVIDSHVDAHSIPNSYLPIVRGYRRLGEERVESISSRGLAMYPTLCLLANYDSPEVISESASIESVSGRDSFDSRHMKGMFVRERRESRTTNTAEFWVSQDVPFGLAGWKVKVDNEVKGATADRSTFNRLTTVTCEMKVREIMDFVESELITDNL